MLYVHEQDSEVLFSEKETVKIACSLSCNVIIVHRDVPMLLVTANVGSLFEDVRILVS